jgi:hypothetical protein
MEYMGCDSTSMNRRYLLYLNRRTPLTDFSVISWSRVIWGPHYHESLRSVPSHPCSQVTGQANSPFPDLVVLHELKSHDSPFPNLVVESELKSHLRLLYFPGNKSPSQYLAPALPWRAADAGGWVVTGVISTSDISTWHGQTGGSNGANTSLLCRQSASLPLLLHRGCVVLAGSGSALLCIRLPDPWTAMEVAGGGSTHAPLSSPFLRSLFLWEIRRLICRRGRWLMLLYSTTRLKNSL